MFLEPTPLEEFLGDGNLLEVGKQLNITQPVRIRESENVRGWQCLSEAV